MSDQSTAMEDERRHFESSLGRRRRRDLPGGVLFGDEQSDDADSAGGGKHFWQMDRNYGSRVVTNPIRRASRSASREVAGAILPRAASATARRRGSSGFLRCYHPHTRIAPTRMRATPRVRPW